MGKNRFSLKHLLLIACALTLLLYGDSWPCSAFLIKKGDHVLVGNNEDWIQTNVRVWFIPASTREHGVVYFGFGGSSQAESHEGGMNDQGLFFDGFGAPTIPDANPLNKPLYQEAVGFPDKALAECDNVEEVAALAERYHLPLHHAMWMFGDRHGESIIIEGEKLVRGNGHYQICTNFRQSELGGAVPSCWRYRKIDSLVQRMGDLTVASCRDALDAVHLKTTQYSYILDLNSRQIYFYHFHDFAQVIEMNLTEELAKGPHHVDMRPLFPEKLGVRFFANMGTAYFLSFSMLFFFLSPVFWAGRLLYRRIVKAKSGEPKTPWKPAVASVLIVGALCVLDFAYLVILLRFPELIPYGQQQTADRGGLLRFVLLILPWLNTALIAALLYFNWIAWKRGFWGVIGRVHYTLISLIGLAVVFVWISWGIIP